MTGKPDRGAISLGWEKGATGTGQDPISASVEPLLPLGTKPQGEGNQHVGSHSEQVSDVCPGAESAPCRDTAETWGGDALSSAPSRLSQGTQ